MKKCLYILLNTTFKNELELLYGKGSIIEITDVVYSTNAKHLSVSCKLLFTDIQLFEETNTEGVEFLIKECWGYTGIEQSKISLTMSVDII